METEGSFPPTHVPSTCLYCTFFCNLLHHSRHVSNRWVHHQGRTCVCVCVCIYIYPYPFALYGFPYGIRQLFLILHCIRKTSVQGKRHWSCARGKATKKPSSNISKPMTMNQKIWIISRTVHKTTTSKMDELDGTKGLLIKQYRGMSNNIIVHLVLARETLK